MMVRKLIVATLLIVAIGAALILEFRPDRAIRVATGAVAHNLCSKTFVSGFDPAKVFSETVEREGLRRLKWLLGYSIDPVGKLVAASIYGLFESRARFRENLGCILVHGDVEPYSPRVDFRTLKATPPALLPEIAGAAVVEPDDARLKAALDHAFEEPADQPFRHTKAVVIVKGGTVIAERYAPGVGIDTPLLGFSMTKSVINTLLGIFAHQGLLTPSFLAPIAQWHGATDPRREIEMEHLQRMTTGLALDETNSGFDVSSQMLYLHDDMAGFAVKAMPVAPPGERWAYSSATTQLLARIIRDKLGGPEQAMRYAWRELFNPLGMRSVIWELDATGTMQGSSYMLASARDWARLGILYLKDGVVGGRRIMSDQWLEYSARATLDSDYGAGFWIFRGKGPMGRFMQSQGVPHNGFMASGDFGQRLVILPSQQLVIVRLGDAADPTNDIAGLARLINETVSATKDNREDVK
jgi:CubicO group peptidase (beta-lactamase class C family)